MARPKSEFLSAWGRAFEIFKMIVDVVLDLGGTDEDLVRLLTDKDRVKRIGQLIVEQPQTGQAVEHFTPVLDAEVPPRHQATLAKYRKLATEWGVAATIAVCYRVKAGYTIRDHAPKHGPCYEQFGYLKSWNFPDEPTRDCLVFWIPRLVPESTSKTRDEQFQLIEQIRQRLELPEHHLSNFGKVALNAGLILAHYKATGERIPLDSYWIRTDTCYADGDRLGLGNFGGSGLLCDRWGFGEGRHGGLGVFAQGVEELGS